MRDDLSLLKAKYCRAVLRTASSMLHADAVRLINGLCTERPSPDTSGDVAAAEEIAFEALYELALSLQIRSFTPKSAEMLRATDAVERWVVAAS